MAQAPLTSIETALENQRLGSLQIRVAALCTLIQMCDGYDLNSEGLGGAFADSNELGTSAAVELHGWRSSGRASASWWARPPLDWIGDRVWADGHCCSGASAILHIALVAQRDFAYFRRPARRCAFLLFFTGLGIGGGFSGAAALALNHAPHRLRATMIMPSFTGAPVGGFPRRPDRGPRCCSHFGRPSSSSWAARVPMCLAALHLAAGIAALFRDERQNLSPRQSAPLRGLNIAPASASHPSTWNSANPITIFRPGRRAADDTPADHFLLQPDELVPVCLLDADGVQHDRHEAGAGGVRLQPARLGAIFAALYLGLVIDQVGPEAPWPGITPPARYSSR